MKTYDAEPVDPKLVGSTLQLPHPKMRIVLYFMTARKTPEGTVPETGTAIAHALGMNRSLYARTIKEVVEDGWLRPAIRVQNIQYFELGVRAGGKPDAKVIPLHRAS